MSKIRLNLKKLSQVDKLALANRVYQQMQNNPYFPTSTPFVQDLLQAKDAAQTAFDEANQAQLIAKQKTLLQTQRFDNLDTVLTSLAAYVESISAGDEMKIQSTGMELRAKSTVPTLPVIPTGLSVQEGGQQGALELRWRKVSNARSYVIEQSINPNSNAWAIVQVSTKATAVINGLTSGQQYWFRVSSVSSAGQSGFSDPATKFAP